MRVLHIIVGLGTGGAELMLERLVAGQADDARWRHQVISLSDMGTVGPRLAARGVPVTALGMRSARDVPRILLALRRAIGKARPDVVQCWMYHADLLGGLAARAAGVRHVAWNVRIADISSAMGVARLTLWIRRACAALSRRVPQRIVYVAQSARKAHEALGYDPAKSVFIPNGYDVPDLAEVRRAGAAVRAGLGLPADTILVGCMGRFSAQKDQRGFVVAAARAASADDRLRFAMIGPGVDVGNPELMGWIAASGIADRFHLLGERRDVPACLAALDIFVLNSIGEGFPNVLAEAMSVATPAIATDVGDSALLLGDTGTVIPPGAPDRLADAVLALVGAGSQTRAAAGAAARERIVGHFSMAAIRAMYRRLYEEMLAEGMVTA